MSTFEAARAERDATLPPLKDWKRPLDADYRQLKARFDWAQAQIEAHPDSARG